MDLGTWRAVLFVLSLPGCQHPPASPALAPHAASDPQHAPDARREPPATPTLERDAATALPSRMVVLGTPFGISAAGERWTLPDGSTLEVLDAGWATLHGGEHIGYARMLWVVGGRPTRVDLNTSNTPRAEVGAYAVRIVSPAPVQIIVDPR